MRNRKKKKNYDNKPEQLKETRLEDLFLILLSSKEKKKKKEINLKTKKKKPLFHEIDKQGTKLK